MDQHPSPTNPSPSRLPGLDLARGLAILGMTVIHFRLVMSEVSSEGTGWLFERLDGRPATLFMLLAGIGISLMSRSVKDDPDKYQQIRGRLICRGLFLLAAGFLNLLIWQGDILRVYGLSFLIAVMLLRRRNWVLLLAAAGFVGGFVLTILVVDYETNWNFETMTYLNQWTMSGLVRSLFYDGFRSVLPWTGVFLFGMWLGRLNLTNLWLRRGLLFGSIVLLLLVELTSSALLAVTLPQANPQEAEELVALFGTASIPPLPLFLVSSVSFSLATLCICISVAQRMADWLPVRGLIATGQMAFTWYVGHIYLGLGTIIVLELFSVPVWVAILTGSGFFVVSAAISLWWRGKGRRGPLEFAIRKICG